MCWSNWVSVPCNSYSSWHVLIKLSLCSLQFTQRLACADQTESQFLAIQTAPGLCCSNWVSVPCNSYSAWHVLIKLSHFSLQFIQLLACADQTESLFLAIHTAPGLCWSNWVSVPCNSYSWSNCVSIQHLAYSLCCSNWVSVPCNSYSAWHVLIKLNHFSLQFIQRLACADQTESLFLAIHTAPSMCWSNWVSVPCNSYSAWLVLIKLSLSSLQFIQRLACAFQTESLFLAIHTAPGLCWSNWVSVPCHLYRAWRVLIQLRLCSLPFIERLTFDDQFESLFLAIHRASGVCWSNCVSIQHLAYSAWHVLIKLRLHTAPDVCWSKCFSVHCHSYSAWRVMIKLSFCSLPFIQRLACANQTASPYRAWHVLIKLRPHTAPDVCWSKCVYVPCHSAPSEWWSNCVSVPGHSYSAWRMLIKLSLCDLPFIEGLACDDQTASPDSAWRVLIKLRLCSLTVIQRLVWADQIESLFLAIHIAPNVWLSHWVSVPCHS